MKAKIRIKNGLRDRIGVKLGDSDTRTGIIRINKKAHKKDKRELASTIKHELLHVKHPKMTEKNVYKKSAKTKISVGEQHKLLAKLKTKARNYKIGAAKRKFKLGRADFQPGTLINKINTQKAEKAAIMGAI